MTKVEISNKLYERLKERLSDTQFKDVDSYISYILEQVLANIKQEENKTEKVLSADEKEAIKKRLKALGYPDEGI